MNPGRSEEEAYEKIRELAGEDSGTPVFDADGVDEETTTDAETEGESEEESDEEEDEESEEADETDTEDDEDEELGFVPIDKHKAATKRETELRQLLESQGFTFKADGTPVPPQTRQEEKPVVSSEYFKEEDIPKPVSHDPEFKSKIEAIRELKAEDMSSNPSWIKLALSFNPDADMEEIESWDAKDWRDLRNEYIERIEKDANSQEQEYRENLSSITKVVEHRSKLIEDPVFAKYPDAANTFDEIVSEAKKQGMTPKEVAEKFEELKDFALGKFLRRNADTLLADAVEKGKKIAQKKAEDVAANRKVVGLQPKVVTTGAKRTTYSREIIEKANRAGMTPKEFVEFSSDKYTYK